ncbi:MAG TPA: cobalamin-dependent protein, partial [Mycobacteriales bacterium]|nr:cobalamin-dependent protein [Mycobacteriales bacterium]
KGFAGEKGLEYYREIRVVNMGAQVTADELVQRAATERADAVLVSQVVAAARDRWKEQQHRPLLVVGGPRFDPRMTAELGVDRIFTKGTTPGEVASYLVHALAGAHPQPSAVPRRSP